MQRLLTRTWTHRVTAAGFLALLVVGSRTGAKLLCGSPTGTRLLDTVPFADPLAGAEAMLASRTATTTLLIGVALTVLIGVALGRVFCGWLCPLGLLLELADDVGQRVRRVLGRLGVRTPQFDVPKDLKYWILAACLVLSFVCAAPVFTAVSPINQTALLLMFAPGPEWAVLGGIAALEFFSRRAFCKSLCPLGALYALIGRFGALRIRVRHECTTLHACQLCTPACPMGIAVFERFVEADRQSIDDAECTRCGACANGCPGELLALGLVWPSSKRDRCPRPASQDIPHGKGEFEQETEAN